MALIARSILRQASAIEAERAMLAGDPVARTEGAEAPAEPAVVAATERSLDPVAEVVPEPAEAPTATDGSQPR